MNERDPRAFLRYLATFHDLTTDRVPGYSRYFAIGAVVYGLGVILIGIQLPIEVLAGVVIISFAAFLPWWLWCRGRAKGLPIWPLFTFTAIMAYAIPLLSEHPIVALFPPLTQLYGAISIAACLLVGTLAWWPSVRTRAETPVSVRLLPMEGGKTIFWGFLIGSLVFNFVTLAGILGSDTQGYTILRGVVLGIATLAVFYFSYQHGVGGLSPIEIGGYITLITLTSIVTVTSMLLVNAMSMFLTAFIGYLLGSGRIPWRAILAVFVIFAFLHAGKGAQRDEYWGEEMWKTVEPVDYPVFFYNWSNHSIETIQEDWFGEKKPKEEGAAGRNLWERSSLMHLFLYFQYSTGSFIPYLGGLTYSVIPELLIPRIFYEEKARAHFGNNVLAVHYGIVENAAETQTSVGFGFINEAYANFGIFGSLGISALLGWFYGWVTKISMSVPLMSFRFLFAVIVLGGAFQVEYTAGVFVSSIFQATMALFGVSLVFMRPYPLRYAYRLLRDVLRAISGNRADEGTAGGNGKAPPTPTPARTADSDDLAPAMRSALSSS